MPPAPPLRRPSPPCCRHPSLHTTARARELSPRKIKWGKEKENKKQTKTRRDPHAAGQTHTQHTHVTGRRGSLRQAPRHVQGRVDDERSGRPTSPVVGRCQPPSPPCRPFHSPAVATARTFLLRPTTPPLTRPSRACCVVTLAAPLFAPLRPSWLSSALVYGLAGAPSRRLCVPAVLLRCFSRPAAGSCRFVLCPLPQLNRLRRQGLKTTTSGAVWWRRAGSWRLTPRPYPPSPPLSPGPSGADLGVVPPRGFESRHHGGRFRERPGDGTGELTCPPWDV